MKPGIGFMNMLTTQNILDDLNFAVENGFDWFEIARDFPQIKETSKSNGLGLIVHMPSYLPTSTRLPELKKGVIDYAKNGIIFAKNIGSDRITLHTGFAEMGTTEMFYDSLIKNLKTIVKIGERYGVNICLENFDNKPTALCIEMKDYLNVLNSVEGLKSTMDVGHANTTQIKPHEYFASVKDFVMNMHIHDNNGKRDEHKCIGEGNIDYKKLFSECKEANYSGPFTLELFPYDNALKGKNRFYDLWGKS
jgi:sugar phosphate isomerase/epimerase